MRVQVVSITLAPSKSDGLRVFFEPRPLDAQESSYLELESYLPPPLASSLHLLGIGQAVGQLLKHLDSTKALELQTSVRARNSEVVTVVCQCAAVSKTWCHHHLLAELVFADEPRSGLSNALAVLAMSEEADVAQAATEALFTDREWLRRAHALVRRILYGRGFPSDSDVEDVVQELRLAVLEGVRNRTYRTETAAFRTWAMGAAVKLALKWRRKSGQTVAGPGSERRAATPASAGALEALHVIREELGRLLPKDTMLALDLRVFEDLTVREIASVLKKQPSTVQGYLSSAVKVARRRFPQLTRELSWDVSH
jgi:RNA polymerase sigma factor (sigma-70 family)